MSRERYFESRWTTGVTVENELFRHIRDAEPGYMPYKKALEYARSNQPWDVTNEAPEYPRFVDDVIVTLAERLGEEDLRKLRFYTAIDSALDKFHGVDGFVELDSEEDGKDPSRVTIDVTTNPNKDQYNADLIFTVPRDGIDPKVDKRQYMEYVQRLVDDLERTFKKSRKKNA